jgi:hypothetical protein
MDVIGYQYYYLTTIKRIIEQSMDTIHLILISIVSKILKTISCYEKVY